jgi:hypothetical protein
MLTVFFQTPMLLLTTAFSLRVVEFPDTLHMTYVLKYMFVISITVIVPSVGIVIYIVQEEKRGGEVSKVLMRLKNSDLRLD